MSEPEEMLERQVSALREEISRRFDNLESKMDRYATKESVRYLGLFVGAMFLLMLTLHGLGSVASGITQVMGK